MVLSVLFDMRVSPEVQGDLRAVGAAEDLGRTAMSMHGTDSRGGHSRRPEVMSNENVSVKVELIRYDPVRRAEGPTYPLPEGESPRFETRPRKCGGTPVF